ncbi:MAG TPA: CSLREA domain-containing protein [Ilumatobacteraceae bacterium]
MNTRVSKVVMSVVLVSGASVFGSSPAVTAANATLHIAAPAQARVGEAIAINLTLAGASRVSGYEGFASFDRSKADFGGVFAGGEDAPQVNVQTAVVGDSATGAGFAVYTCEAVDCPGDHNNKKEGRRQLQNVRLRVVPLTAGALDIRFDDLRFVDKKGRRLDVAVQGAALSVVVDGSTQELVAPPPNFELSDLPETDPTADPALPPGKAPDSLDETDDGVVTFTDAATVSMAWADARVAGGACSDPTGNDVNGDGCVDVSDLQLVAATANAPTTVAAPAAVAAAGVQFVVNTTSDASDSAIGNGVCATSAGTCSLRAALQEANRITGPNSIAFNIPGAGVHTIQLASQLNISDSSGGVTIDGYTQTGATPNTAAHASNAHIMIEVRGNGTSTALGTFDAMRIVSPNNVIRGLSVYNALDQIQLYGATANHNHILGNFVGTNAAATFTSIRGTAAGGTGIHLEAGSHHNVFGTPTLADRNVFDGAPYAGIRIDHENSDFNVIQNNIFGLTPNGLAKLPNRQSGIDLQFGASNNLVGGLGANEGNVLSGHPYTGVDLSHSTSTSNNEVVGNFIGTNLTGDKVTSYTKTFFGVTFKDDVAKNFVHDNVIGGATEYPIWHKHSYTGGNTIANNLIGIARNGTALPNSKYAMYMQGHDFIVRNNVFANSALGGIFLDFDVSDRNEFTGNTFKNNGGLAIDLAPAGPTPNDAGDVDTGPNENLNYPVLTSASTTAVRGRACAGCRVEIYRSAVDTGNRGEGNKLVGSATASAAGSFSAAVSGLVAGDHVAAIAIDPSHNTSEFSTVLTV